MAKGRRLAKVSTFGRVLAFKGFVNPLEGFIGLRKCLVFSFKGFVGLRKCLVFSFEGFVGLRKCLVFSFKGFASLRKCGRVPAFKEFVRDRKLGRVLAFRGSFGEVPRFRKDNRLSQVDGYASTWGEKR